MLDPMPHGVEEIIGNKQQPGPAMSPEASSCHPSLQNDWGRSYAAGGARPLLPVRGPEFARHARMRKSDHLWKRKIASRKSQT
jgi:hypothetical protein